MALYNTSSHQIYIYLLFRKHVSDLQYFVIWKEDIIQNLQVNILSLFDSYLTQNSKQVSSTYHVSPPLIYSSSYMYVLVIPYLVTI